MTKTKQCVLDYLGCAIGGVNLESSEIVRRCFKLRTAPKESTAILYGKRPCEIAAFINAAASHALEMDDLNYGAGGHPAVVIMPAAFAVAEKQDADGSSLLKAIIAGYDLMYRIGRAANPDSQFERGFHPTSINGVFGAALAAALLMNLPERQIVSAIGIAGSFTSGNLECYADGSLTKRINPAVAAQGGVLSAMLAGEGFTGPKWIFEGRSGFLNAYSDDADSSKLTEKLDYTQFGIMRTGFKPYANCRYNHSPIYAALQLREKHAVDYREIEEVTVRVIGMAIRGVCEPKEVKYNPQNIVDAQFSLPYSIAVSLIDGRAFVEQYTEEKLHDPEIRVLMARVKMEHSTELDKMLPKAFPAEVIIRLRNGDVLSGRVDYCKGDPEEPMTEGELEEKFSSLACINVEDEKKITGIIKVVKRLDQVKVSELISFLA